MGLTIDKILVIMVIAMFIVGPERLPLYAKKLGDLVRSVKRMATGAKDRLRDEMGPEFDQVDWQQLDPRQYDPRRIVRDALLEDERESQAEARRSRASHTSQTRRIGGEPMSGGAAAAAGGAGAGMTAGAGMAAGAAMAAASSTGSATPGEATGSGAVGDAYGADDQNTFFFDEEAT